MLVRVKKDGRAKLLRITKESSNGRTVIKLEGKLGGPWVEELRRMWTEESSKSLTLDMRGVTAIDQYGEQLLARMAGSGACFVADTPMTKYIVERAAGGLGGTADGGKEKGK
jgi:hypothetical protein